jgi:exonuclease III
MRLLATLLTLAKLAVLAPIYGLFLALRWLFRRPVRAVLSLAACGAAVALASHLSGCAHPLRVATFNIRQFGVAPTDMDKLTTLVVSLDADILAAQEIQDAAKFRDLAERMSRGGRAYRATLSRCGGKSEMLIGFLYDENRVELVSTKEYPELDPGGGGRCDAGERPGLLGVFTDGTRTVHLLAIHFTPGNDRADFAKRKLQWQRAYAIVRQLRGDGAGAVVILGDANSAGYLKDDNGERAFVDSAAREADMSVVTSGLACSEYWRESDGVYSPSLLDHAVATDGVVEKGTAHVHGYCERLRCAAYEGAKPPEGYDAVSDHCPVTFEVSGAK